MYVIKMFGQLQRENRISMGPNSRTTWMTKNIKRALPCFHDCKVAFNLKSPKFYYILLTIY